MHLCINRALGAKNRGLNPLFMVPKDSPMSFVEHRGVEPLTSTLRTLRSTN